MKRTLIAAAVLASAAGSAYAVPSNMAYLFNATGVSEGVGIEGYVTLFGCVSVSSTAGAVINNSQTTGGGTLLPQAQSYVSGNVTTTFNNTNASVTGTGTNSSYKYSNASNTGMSSSSSSSSHTHDVNASTTKASSSSSTYGKTLNASVNANYHVSTDNGGTHDHTTASTYSDTGNAALGTSYSSVGNNTSTKSQSGNGDLQANASWSHSGNRRNGSAGVDLSGSESTSHTTTNSHNNSDTTNAGASWALNNNRNTSNSSTTANTAYADGTGSAALTASVNGTSSKTKNSSDTYAHTYSTSSTSADSHEHSSSRSSSSNSGWGYNVSDTLNTVDERTTGSVTQHYNTQAAGTLNATTGSGAATNVTGNLGVNIAEGINNAQSNDVALASVDMGNVFGNAQIFNNQASSGSATVKNFNLNASVGDGSLAGVSGNVGVNVASGVGNAQNNSLAGSVTTATPGAYSTVAMVASDNNVQNAGMSATGQFQGTASLGANTLTGAQGNIGVNIAGGIGNLQHNGMAIAAMNNGH
ncbi:cell wall anchor protein [Paraburkholderia sp. J76]|uniref:beta strand repeat-containing protein n=1 Tax=Paraburkholderia sp. J76 TaxID=2805439 RepID=UPI002ABE8507|nr:cell wall anchor protein [Paraburkholderia sp. J76]